MWWEAVDGAWDQNSDHVAEEERRLSPSSVAWAMLGWARRLGSSFVALSDARASGSNVDVDRQGPVGLRRAAMALGARYCGVHAGRPAPGSRALGRVGEDRRTVTL